MAIESSVLLDAIGRKLLAALQEDARLSYAELGRRIGLSPAATAERLRRLEEVGIITGYRVEIDREALGLPVMAIVRLSCDGVKYRPFLKAVQAMERVMECHHVAGGDAFILKVVAGSVEGLGQGESCWISACPRRVSRSRRRWRGGRYGWGSLFVQTFTP